MSDVPSKLTRARPNEARIPRPAGYTWACNSRQRLREEAYPDLQIPRFHLRPFAVSDIRELAALAGLHRVADTATGVPHPYTEAYAHAWISSHAAAWARRHSLHWAITETASDQLFGYVGLTLDRGMTPQAELRFWVARGVERNDVATQCSQRVLQYAWTTLRTARIYALQRLRSRAAGHVLERLGMSPLGDVCMRLPESSDIEAVTLWILDAHRERAHSACRERPSVTRGTP